MKMICMLLNGSILNDSRVIKTIKTLSEKNSVDLFYIGGTAEDKSLFNQNVRLNNSEHKTSSLKTKIIKHSLFYNEFLFFVKEVLKQEKQYDYIYANDLPCLKPAVLLGGKLNSKVIYDAHEIYTETINQFFPQRAPFFKRMIFSVLITFMKYVGVKIERKYLKSVDHFITVGVGLKCYFEKKYYFENIKVVMNCPTRTPILDKINYFKLLGVKHDSFLLLYQGVLNEGRGLRLLINAMENTMPEVVLVIIGYGVLEETLNKLVVQKALQKKVIFLGKVDADKLNLYTTGVHCGINLLEPINQSKALAAPNKLFQYIQASIPVIASYSFENNIVFDKYSIGVLTENNSGNIADAINKMAISDRSVYIENCKKAALEYNWENQEKNLLSVFE
ncbi:MAG: glycosyltransferase [Salinivirgaceae bacterium]|nr:glycosyltransferase [Salinivirgaceae bacterium]